MGIEHQKWLEALMGMRNKKEKQPFKYLCAVFDETFALKYRCQNFLAATPVKPGQPLPNLVSLYREFHRVLYIIQIANALVCVYTDDRAGTLLRCWHWHYARYELLLALKKILEFLEKKEIKLILKEIKKNKKICGMRFQAKGRFSTYFRLGEIVRLFVRERQQLRKNFNKLNTCLAKINQAWKKLN